MTHYFVEKKWKDEKLEEFIERKLYRIHVLENMLDYFKSHVQYSDESRTLKFPRSHLLLRLLVIIPIWNQFTFRSVLFIRLCYTILKFGEGDRSGAEAVQNKCRNSTLFSFIFFTFIQFRSTHIVILFTFYSILFIHMSICDALHEKWPNSPPCSNVAINVEWKSVVTVVFIQNRIVLYLTTLHWTLCPCSSIM